MLVLTEDEQLLRDSVDGFLADHGPVSAFRRWRDAGSQGHDRDLWAAMGAQGYAGVLVPEEQGGAGLGFVGAGLICEAIGRNLAAVPFVPTAVMAATALVRGGNAALAARLLPQIAAAGTVIAVAVDETRRHDPARLTLAARRSGNGWQLDGVKTFVAEGASADAVIVAARLEEGGTGLFVVARGAPGLTVEPMRMVDARDAARLVFAGVPVTAGDALGMETGDAAGLLAIMLDAGRVGAAAELLGVAEEARTRTVAYLQERRQFGRVIGSFQALQHRAAQVFVEVELARSCLLHALQRMEADPETAGPAVALAKARCSAVARLAGNEGIQMHGGIGMTDDFDIGLFVKRARVAGEWLGDAAFHSGRLLAAGGI